MSKLGTFMYGYIRLLQALAIASYYVNEWPLLIVVPSSLRYAWQEVGRIVWWPESTVFVFLYTVALLLLCHIVDTF